MGGRVYQFGDGVWRGRVVGGMAEVAPFKGAEAALEGVEGLGHELEIVIFPLNGIQSSCAVGGNCAGVPTRVSW